MSRISRRRLLQVALAAGAAPRLAAAQRAPDGNPALAAFAPVPGAKYLGAVPFIEEGDVALGRTVGKGLDGRRALDLARLSAATLLTPADEFFIRTRWSAQPVPGSAWTIHLRDRAGAARVLRLADLGSAMRSCGTHLVECAGNTRLAAFGLISTARWHGIPLANVLDRVAPPRTAGGIRVRGLDPPGPSKLGSVRGAGWIFTREQLERAGAFLATAMNGRPLAADHGGPLRLIVPGWYGCVCIKWVDEIALVDADAPPTGQMLEYATRTYQSGALRRARDFAPATVDAAAMPVRVERWRRDGRLLLRVVGILWGGERPVRALMIRFSRDGSYVPVQHCQQRSNASWTVWWQLWEPPIPKRYWIRLRIDDPGVRARRLASGFYERGFDLEHL